MITLICTNRETAEDFYKANKGMIGQLRKMTKDRVMELLATISGKKVAA